MTRMVSEVTKKAVGIKLTPILDPSININIYTDQMKNTTNYTIPGGPIWDG